MSTGKENNEQLVQKIKAGEDVTGNMAKLWQQNRNFVYLIARKYAKTETDIDDLMQEGYLGMYRAIGPYDLLCRCCLSLLRFLLDPTGNAEI